MDKRAISYVGLTITGSVIFVLLTESLPLWKWFPLMFLFAIAWGTFTGYVTGYLK